MKVTEEDLVKTKFQPFVPHSFVKSCKHSSLPGLSASTNPFNNHVTIFAERVRDRYGSSWTRYTVSVAGDEYGETVDEIEMPRGTTLKQAQEKAIEIAKLYVKNGDLYV